MLFDDLSIFFDPFGKVHVVVWNRPRDGRPWPRTGGRTFAAAKTLSVPYFQINRANISADSCGVASEGGAPLGFLIYYVASALGALHRLTSRPRAVKGV